MMLLLSGSVPEFAVLSAGGRHFIMPKISIRESDLKDNKVRVPACRYGILIIIRRTIGFTGRSVQL